MGGGPGRWPGDAPASAGRGALGRKGLGEPGRGPGHLFQRGIRGRAAGRGGPRPQPAPRCSPKLRGAAGEGPGPLGEACPAPEPWEQPRPGRAPRWERAAGARSRGPRPGSARPALRPWGGSAALSGGPGAVPGGLAAEGVPLGGRPAAGRAAGREMLRLRALRGGKGPPGGGNGRSESGEVGKSGLRARPLSGSGAADDPSFRRACPPPSSPDGKVGRGGSRDALHGGPASESTSLRG